MGISGQLIYLNDLQPEHRSGKGITVQYYGKIFSVNFAEQKTGFGIRKFFVCPVCGKRRTKLFLCGSGLFCVDCADLKPYKDIQNATKGGYREIQYRMERFAERNGITIKKWPFEFVDYADHPAYNRKKFQKALKILQVLENMRLQNILFKTTFRQRTIKAVLTGKHPALTKYTLPELQKKLWVIE